MLILQQEHDAGRLAIERRRDVQDGLVDEFLDTGIRDDGLLAQTVVRTTILERLEELSGHCYVL
jgi:hypothetical protein